MKKQKIIRKQIFETNSSSAHSLTISNYNILDNKLDKNLTDFTFYLTQDYYWSWHEETVCDNEEKTRYFLKNFATLNETKKTIEFLKSFKNYFANAKRINFVFSLIELQEDFENETYLIEIITEKFKLKSNIREFDLFVKELLKKTKYSIIQEIYIGIVFDLTDNNSFSLKEIEKLMKFFEVFSGNIDHQSLDLIENYSGKECFEFSINEDVEIHIDNDNSEYLFNLFKHQIIKKYLKDKQISKEQLMDLFYDNEQALLSELENDYGLKIVL